MLVLKDTIYGKMNFQTELTVILWAISDRMTILIDYECIIEF